mgnify:FL=1
MKEVFKITGLDCPNCARALENKINQIDCVNDAKIDFLKSSMTVESDNLDKAFNKIVKLSKKLEPDAKISRTIEDNQKKSKFLNLFSYIILVVGIILGLVVVFAPMNSTVNLILLIISAIFIGYKTYYKAFQLLIKGVVNENLLITISVVGAIFVNASHEGLMVIGLYTIGKILESLALDKSRKSISKLTDLKPQFVKIIRDNEEIEVSPENVNIGDIMIIRTGERVALDGVLLENSCNIDTQSLTGESLPQQKNEGDEILSGSVVIDNVIKVKATKLYKDSAVNKILELIENSENKKSKTETFIAKISKWYTLGVMVLAVIVFGITMLVTKNFNVSIYRGLIFLVVSCPCAFAISVPLSYFSGIGRASKSGILIKGSNYLDMLTKLNIIAFDKTGTITTGEFEIVEIVAKDEYNKSQILHFARLGEQYSIHPLAKAILSGNTEKLEAVNDYKEIAGKGIEYKYNDDMFFIGRYSENLDSTTIEVVKNQQLIGAIKLKDTIKESSVKAIEKLKQMNIKTIMLSGDNQSIVNEVASKVNIDKAYSNLLPQDKYEHIEKEKSNGIIGYVGDGVNDAPSLTISDVGFSMGLNGSSASIEASSVVISNDNLEKIPESIKISKFTRKIVLENIAFSGIVKVVFLTLGAIGITGMLSAVIADVGVTLLAILNSLRVLTYKTDKIKFNDVEIK